MCFLFSIKRCTKNGFTGMRQVLHYCGRVRKTDISETIQPLIKRPTGLELIVKVPLTSFLLELSTVFISG